MTSSESEYSLGDEEMEAADEIMAEDQLEARSQSDVDTEDHTDLVSLVKYLNPSLSMLPRYWSHSIHVE